MATGGVHICELVIRRGSYSSISVLFISASDIKEVKMTALQEHPHSSFYFSAWGLKNLWSEVGHPPTLVHSLV